jgi:SAM-dependent methyltransferase
MITALAEDDAMYDGRDDHYLRVGQSAATVIERAMRGVAPARILDLPCGHGRVTRVLRAMYPEAAITACDIDTSGVDFAAAHFSARGVYSKPDFRDLSLSESYDLIWVGSLITHLSEQHCRRFLDFTVRHLAPGGVLVITSHGEHVAHRLLTSTYGLTDAAARGLLADSWIKGYGYRNYPGGDGYGLSLVRRAWFDTVFAGSPLQLERYEPQAWDEHQDALVLRRHEQESLAVPKGLAARVRRTWGRPGRGAPHLFDNGVAAAFPAGHQEEIDQRIVTGFDEGWYLAADPVVARAVAAGMFASGFDHYCTYGWREARAFCDPSLSYDATSGAAAAKAR